MRRVIIVVAVFVALGTMLLVTRWRLAHVRPSHTLGVRNGQLAACPDASNCISSTSLKPQQKMAPMALTSTPEQALEDLKAIILDRPRSRIVAASDRYIHAEFRSFVFGFVDDVEFLIDEPNAVIHFRASARVGMSDFGVNRRRMEWLCEQFARFSSNAN